MNLKLKKSEIEMKIGQERLSHFDKIIIKRVNLINFQIYSFFLSDIIEWVSETRSIKSNGEGLEINLQIDNKTATVKNGQEIIHFDQRKLRAILLFYSIIKEVGDIDGFYKRNFNIISNEEPSPCPMFKWEEDKNSERLYN